MRKFNTGNLFVLGISMVFGNDLAFAQPLSKERVIPNLTDRSAPELLAPVIKEYLDLTDFKSRNEFAFRFANRLDAYWWFRMAAIASNTLLSEKEKQCVFHLASAKYTKHSGIANVNMLLDKKDDVLTNGILNIIWGMRDLSPDGADQLWPDSKPIGNRFIRSELVKLLTSPKFSKKASDLLGAYGAKGIDVIDKLVSVLLVDDPSSQHAAASAILAIDPNGVSKELGITINLPFTILQQKKIHGFVRSQRSKFQAPFEEVMNYVKKTSDADFAEKRAYSSTFKRNYDDAEWWGHLSLAVDVCNYNELETLQVLATELYSMPASKKDIIKVLQSEERMAVRGMLFLLEGFFHFEQGNSGVETPTLGVCDDDLDFWPHYIAAVLGRFPDLSMEVARSLAMYPGAEAEKEAKRLVPFLLTNDPNLTIRLRRFFTDIDKETATKLGIAMTGDEELMASLSEQARVLTPEQRTKVQSFLQQ